MSGNSDPARLRADADRDQRRVDQLDPDGTHPLGVIARHWIGVALESDRGYRQGHDRIAQQGT